MGESFPSCLFRAFSHQRHPAHQTSALWGCFSTALYSEQRCWAHPAVPSDVPAISESSEASFAGAFGSKSCSRGPLLRLLSPADDVGEEKARGERMTSRIRSGNRSPPPRSEGCWKGARAKRCQQCLHPRTPLRAVFANAEAMLFSEEPASSADKRGVWWLCSKP